MKIKLPFVAVGYVARFILAFIYAAQFVVIWMVIFAACATPFVIIVMATGNPAAAALPYLPLAIGGYWVYKLDR